MEQSRKDRRRLMRAAGLVVAVAGAWVGRRAFNLDLTSYLDVADAYAAKDWAHALNGHWSPLYSWLFLGARFLLEPLHLNELQVAHVVTLGCAILALFCFDDLFAALSLWRRRRLGEAGGAWEWLWTLGAYLVFWHAALNLVSVQVCSGDMPLAAMVFLAAGALTRIALGEAGLWTYALFGAALGLGALAKSFMFPLSIVFLVVAVAVEWKRRRGARLLLSAALLVAVAGPFVVGLSRSKGRLTFGDAGAYNYLVFVDGAPGEFWLGEPAGTGNPLHPPTRIWTSPDAFSFAQPVGGTFPIWYDESYWYEGMRPHVDWRGQLTALLNSVATLVSLLGIEIPLLGLVLLLGLRRGSSSRARELWFLWAPALAGLAAYALVLTQFRYIAPFVALLWISALALVSARPLPAEPRRERMAQVGLALFACIILGWSVKAMVQGARDNSEEQFIAARQLAQVGVSRGALIGIVGHGGHAYWARLAGVKIVAEVVPGSLAEFGSAPGLVRAGILDRMRQAGAQWVISVDQPPATEASLWHPLGAMGLFGRRL